MMKKIFIFSLLVLSVFILACAPVGEAPETDEQGNAVGFATSTIQWLSCVDSDGGNTPNVYGKLDVKYRGVDGVDRAATYPDVCWNTESKTTGVTGDAVRERYCSSNNYPAYGFVACANGCKEGACVVPVPVEEELAILSCNQ